MSWVLSELKQKYLHMKKNFKYLHKPVRHKMKQYNETVSGMSDKYKNEPTMNNIDLILIIHTYL